MSEEAKWFVVHTYSGYENKVKANIEKIIENRGMQDQIYEVLVPMEDVMEIKKGKSEPVSRKIFPGYVFLKMFMNDDTWYVVRNTRGVTSFVGPGSKPVPLTDDEIENMGLSTVLEAMVDDRIKVGMNVKIIAGAYENHTGLVKEVNHNKRSAIVGLLFAGRETPTEVDFEQIQELS